jgi:hypothetical protein
LLWSGFPLLPSKPPYGYFTIRHFAPDYDPFADDGLIPRYLNRL